MNRYYETRLRHAAGVVLGWPWRLLNARLRFVHICFLFNCAVLGPFVLILFIKPWSNFNPVVHALSDIQSAEIALIKLLSDAGRSNLSDLLDPVVFEKTCAWYEIQYGVDEFEAQTAIYTRAAYALLISGRAAMEPALGDDTVMIKARKTLLAEHVKNLGTAYISELGNDDWGNPYQFYAGPWPDTMGPVLFRAYDATLPGHSLPGDSYPTVDALTVTITGEDPDHHHGFPASRHQEIFIWSLGANGVSDQPRYDPIHRYAPPARQYYRADAPDEYLGGGDDINNWDENQSYMRFYN